MKATLFIIPGFKEQVSDEQYLALRKSLPNKDYKVVFVPIVWNHCVMTDWIDQFLSFYKKNCGEKNIVLGFSYGAMIALLTAKTLRPAGLFLCSLSPYFSEDLQYIPERWKHFIGKRRMEDFRRYSMKEAVRGLRIKTKMFIGSVEQEKFVHLKRRSTEAAEALLANLIVIPGVSHDIGDERYQDTLARELI